MTKTRTPDQWRQLAKQCSVYAAARCMQRSGIPIRDALAILCGRIQVTPPPSAKAIQQASAADCYRRTAARRGVSFTARYLLGIGYSLRQARALLLSPVAV